MQLAGGGQAEIDPGQPVDRQQAPSQLVGTLGRYRGSLPAQVQLRHRAAEVGLVGRDTARRLEQATWVGAEMPDGSGPGGGQTRAAPAALLRASQSCWMNSFRSSPVISPPAARAWSASSPALKNAQDGRGPQPPAGLADRVRRRRRPAVPDPRDPPLDLARADGPRRGLPRWPGGRPERGTGYPGRRGTDDAQRELGGVRRRAEDRIHQDLHGIGVGRSPTTLAAALKKSGRSFRRPLPRFSDSASSSRIAGPCASSSSKTTRTSRSRSCSPRWPSRRRTSGRTRRRCRGESVEHQAHRFRQFPVLERADQEPDGGVRLGREVDLGERPAELDQHLGHELAGIHLGPGPVRHVEAVRFVRSHPVTDVRSGTSCGSSPGRGRPSRAAPALRPGRSARADDPAAGGG